jgi:hypothetical protein
MALRLKNTKSALRTRAYALAVYGKPGIVSVPMLGFPGRGDTSLMVLGPSYSQATEHFDPRVFWVGRTHAGG